MMRPTVFAPHAPLTLQYVHNPPATRYPLGRLGAMDIGGGLTFKGDAGNDFIKGLGQNGGCDGRAPPFRPLSAAVLAQVVSRLHDIDTSSDPSAADAWRDKASFLISECDRLQQWDNGFLADCGRSEAREKQYHAALNTLKAHVQTAISLPVPPPAPANPAAYTGGTTSKQALTSTPQRLQITSDSNGPTFTPDEGPPWLLIAGSVLAVGAAGFVVYKVARKRRTALSGYRRRSRSRRSHSRR